MSASAGPTCWRCGLVLGADAQLQKVGESLGITRERVRQIQAKAEEKSLEKSIVQRIGFTVWAEDGGGPDRGSPVGRGTVDISSGRRSVPLGKIWL